MNAIHQLGDAAAYSLLIAMIVAAIVKIKYHKPEAAKPKKRKLVRSYYRAQ